MHPRRYGTNILISIAPNLKTKTRGSNSTTLETTPRLKKSTKKPMHLGHEQWWHTQLVASCKKVVRSNMMNFIPPMKDTTLVRKK
jgi:hypothetical protein